MVLVLLSSLAKVNFTLAPASKTTQSRVLQASSLLLTDPTADPGRRV